MGVKTAFLNGSLEEEVYMDQPEGFIIDGKENKVCLLKRSIYGLKQASRQCYLKFLHAINVFGFNEIWLISAFTRRSVGVSLHFWFYVLMIS